MLVRYLLDENLRGILWGAISLHNQGHRAFIDCVRVGDPEDLPRGSGDGEILQWAEREKRVIISMDKRTMPLEARTILERGGHFSGVLLVRAGFSARAIVDYLELLAHATELDEWRDRIEFIP
jgi:hypothetical protein